MGGPGSTLLGPNTAGTASARSRGRLQRARSLRHRSGPDSSSGRREGSPGGRCVLRRPPGLQVPSRRGGLCRLPPLTRSVRRTLVAARRWTSVIFGYSELAGVTCANTADAAAPVQVLPTPAQRGDARAPSPHRRPPPLAPPAASARRGRCAGLVLRPHRFEGRGPVGVRDDAHRLAVADRAAVRELSISRARRL